MGVVSGSRVLRERAGDMIPAAAAAAARAASPLVVVPVFCTGTGVTWLRDIADCERAG